MAQPPDFVLKVFKRVFGSNADAEALYEALLKYSDKETPRVHLAILKLSDGDPKKLAHYIDAARVDYRDVLAWAEYPEQLRSGARRDNTPPEKYDAILRADRIQYEDWLSEHQDLDLQE